jgi:hypothetical protein
MFARQRSIELYRQLDDRSGEIKKSFCELNSFALHQRLSPSNMRFQSAICNLHYAMLYYAICNIHYAIFPAPLLKQYEVLIPKHLRFLLAVEQSPGRVVHAIGPEERLFHVTGGQRPLFLHGGLDVL